MTRHVILHILRNTRYGAAENAFCTIRKDIPDLSHVFIEAGENLDGKFDFHDKWIESVRDIQQRSDYHVRYTGKRLDYSEDAFCVISYDIPYLDVMRIVNPGKARVIVWNFGSLSNSDAGDGIYRTCVSDADDSNSLYPMLDTNRLAILSGNTSVHTTGIMLDPWTPGFRIATARRVIEGLSRLDSPHRVLMTVPEGPYRDDPEVKDLMKYILYGKHCEVILKHMCIGYDWMYQTQCQVCVSDYSLCPHDTYGYYCATAMLMGKLLICDSNNAYSRYSRDRVSAIHFGNPKDIYKYIEWSENNSKSSLIRAAAQYAVYPHDKDPALMRLRSDIGLQPET